MGGIPMITDRKRSGDFDPAREQAELAKLLEEAMRNPGVREAIEVYDRCREKVDLFKSIQRSSDSAPVFAASDSSCLRLGLD